MKLTVLAAWIAGMAAWSLILPPQGLARTGGNAGGKAALAIAQVENLIIDNFGGPAERLGEITLEDTVSSPLLSRSAAPASAGARGALPLQSVPIRDPDRVWVEATLTSMTLEEKIGQLIVPSQHSMGESLINAYHVGGFVFTGNGQQAADIVATTNRLQTFMAAQEPLQTPLWFAIDAEAGLGARVADATIFPMLMAFGAANDTALMDALGRVTARECRAGGVQAAYGPVADVNTEPINPIISTRAFGDRPELVSRLAREFLRGARAEGLRCTLKH